MDDSRLGGANYRKALIACQRMERASRFCQVYDSNRTYTNHNDGMWFAHPQELRNGFIKSESGYNMNYSLCVLIAGDSST